MKIILAVLSITFVLGLFDDLVQIKPLVKILGQALAGSVAFFLLDIKLSSFYGLFGNIHFNDWISYPLTIFTIIILTNAFNLIDGIDGLAGSFSVVCLIFFGTWFYVVGETYLSIICFAMVGAIIGFLIFNWQPSQIFMGDTGALLIGMMISIAAIKFININYDLPLNSIVRFEASVSTAISVIIIPVVDTIRIIIIRLSLGVSPLTPDKRHIHHSLLRIGLSHQEAVLLLTSIHLFFISGALMMKSISELTVLFFVVALSLTLSFLLHFFLIKQLRQENLI
ncbi:MraY family glycosyltransferase [Chryseosolibacter indicus]|uniref:Undecaprenyl/decaprenyl-phosphate alpha-N-acetylglucosaminyl 1-phosphate transferase n=1 Tax=Chryseosolibacter indicus TaxID=2782351 RepID=A0ABS5VT30_9BACT|nr:MraY family glycosyltransferase [Chryseosolibacter indicus]MBT1704567.1 undecaprenyl/decaprenyl-phosphate alpha-N-acetylglucosaminyl 1-phosphate transferase [Chryseosolibacter indicus]